MLSTVIKKEILENLYSYKFAIITLLSVVLVCTSIFVMYRDYELRLDEFESLKPSAKKVSAGVQPTPLSIFVRGLDEKIGRSFKISEGIIYPGKKRQESYNKLFRLFTTPDLLYMVKVILALCAILFSFNAVTGEKEAGTLGLTLSNSLGRAKLLIGKWLGGFACLTVPFLAAAALGVILVTLSPYVSLDGEKWLKLALILLGSLIYLAFFFSLGLLASCLTQRSASTLIFSLFLWVLLVFVIPSLGGVLAGQMEAVPAVQLLDVKKSQIITAIMLETQEKMRNRERGADFKPVMVDMESDRLIADYRNRLNRQAALARAITHCSPAAAYTLLATDLAGTGLIEKQKMKQAILQYKSSLRDIPRNRFGLITGDVPAFSYKRSGLIEVLSNEGLINLAVLLLQNVVVFAAALVAFIRYDVR